MEELFNKQIINGKRGNIYRGHIITSECSNKHIGIHNTFWDVTMSETYNSETNQTKSQIYYMKDNPKWLQKLIDEIDIFNFTTYFDNDLEKCGNKLEVMVNPGYATYNVEYISPGIAFKDPKEIITEIRKFRKIFSSFHKKIKKQGKNIKDFKIDSSFTLNDRFFNEFDIALATDIKGLPF
mgnify:CR=1 FL=1